MRKVISYGIIALCLSCTNAPITGRPQLKLVSDETIAKEFSMSYREMMNKYKDKGELVVGTQDHKRLQRVGLKIAGAVEEYLKQNNMYDKLKTLNWEFNLVKSEEVNAWCGPGGKIVFYTGIMKYFKNDAELAFVTGHEIGHAIAGHNSERKSQTNLSGWLMLGKSIADVVTNGATSVIDNDLIGTGLSMGLQKFSRNNELEADKYGMIFMAMAGYDPSKAIETWEKMMANSGNKKFTLMDSHPSDESRVKAMKKFLPEAMKYYKK